LITWASTSTRTKPSKEKFVNKFNFVKRLLLLTLLSTFLLTGAAGAADRVGDFSLLDQKGLFHNMSWYDDHVAIAFLVQTNGSAATEKALPAFEALKVKYDSSGIEFMMINPMGKLNRDSVQKELARLGSQIPVLMDDARVISESLGIDKTGEVLIYNPSSFIIEYRGPVENSEIALQELIAGKAVSTTVVAVMGDPVNYPMLQQHQQSPISYADEIAPIITENCAECHRDGGIAPFAMDSHTMIQGWSPMIREVLMTKRMPPGQIDSHVGEFINSRLLSEAEVQKVIHWIEAGASNNDDNDPLTKLVWPESKWAFGEPDQIIPVPEQHVPATGVLDYRYIDVPIDLGGRDRWLRASQYLPGDRTVLHHTVNNLFGPGQTERIGRNRSDGPDQAKISGYTPGKVARMDPANTGGLLKDGSILKLNIHYTTTGKETVDRGEIGLWFYPEGEVPMERMSSRCACIFTAEWTNIPPYDPNFEQAQTITIAKDAHVFSMSPHMHFRGKSMRFVADYPDGTSEKLINIANYNYNWQLSYSYKEPKFVPAGTKITAIGTFDNSVQNPANPDPARSVPWGQQSWDEMFFGSVRWKNLDQGSD
jgi:mono/diheme cytochrome c family protein